MANYIDSTVFINDSKRAIVDFLNKGLKNNKMSLRVSIRMHGEQIASLLADLDREHCLATFSIQGRNLFGTIRKYLICITLKNYINKPVKRCRG